MPTSPMRLTDAMPVVLQDGYRQPRGDDDESGMKPTLRSRDSSRLDAQEG